MEQRQLTCPIPILQECSVLLTAFWGPRPDGKTILLPCNSWSPLEHWTSHLKDSRVTQVAWERSQSEGLGTELKYKLFREIWVASVST